AFSDAMPCCTFATCRTVPPAAGRTGPYSSAFRAIPRLTSRVSRMSTTDFNFPASSDVSVSAISFSSHSIFEALPRKSNRVAISLEACWTALETSWASTLLTTSKEKSWGTGQVYSQEPTVNSDRRCDPPDDRSTVDSRLSTLDCRLVLQDPGAGRAGHP